MPRRSTDRELLLGVLALKNDFIDRHALVAAFDLWAHKREQPLADVLRELGHLREQDLAVLDALVENHLARHGGDPLQSLAAVVPSAAAREGLASLAEIEPAAVRDHARSALAALIEPLATTVSVGQSTSEGTRFCILRPHAKGGLGEVYVADDQELHREVALKQMRERHADDAPSRARFLVEAEITGGLQHPGIVPVYGLGAYPNGRPFYAMRFIRGETLHDAILRFHSTACDGNRAPGEPKHDADARGIAGDPTPHVSQPGQVTAGDRPPLDDGLPLERDPASNRWPMERTTAPSYGSREFRELLSRFIAVCQAIEYAHSRGVVHRDLKPQNIMLGRFGETLVVDWGLAKPLGHTQGATKAPAVPNERAAGFGSDYDGKQRVSSSDEPPLLPHSGQDSEPTQMGRVLGTPAYMSPEQAAGRHDLLTPASDVYALGATLYCLLTGQPPFASDADGRMLERVEKGVFAPPQTVCRAVPRPLEAICLKAMALSAADRYPSAMFLADDLQRWLADEPVAVHRERFGERAGRWLRGHRAATRAAAVAVLLIAVVSLGALALVDAVRRNTASALAAETNAKNAETAAKQAETAAKNEAKSAIDRFVETVEEAELLKDDRFQPLRKKLLSEALSYYQAFIDAHEHNAAARAEIARALSNVGTISNLSGSTTDAITAHQRTLEILEKLVAENPNITEYRGDLGKNYHILGDLQKDTGGREAAANYQRALAIREKLAAENPNVTQYQSDLAKTYQNFGALQSDTGDREAALANYQRAFTIREKLVLENPGDAHYKSELAKGFNDLGFLQHEMGDLVAARVSYQRAVAIHQELVEENPAEAKYQVNLAIHLNNLGNVQLAMGDLEAARASYQRALAITEKLATENPTVTHYRHYLGHACHNLGHLPRKAGEYEAARANLLRAQAIFEKLSAENPSVTQYRSDLGKSWFNLGKLELETPDPPAALVGFQRAVAIFGKLVAENPTVTEYQGQLASAYYILGNIQHETGDREAALVSYQRALAIQEKRAAESPTITGYRDDLASIIANLGNLQRDTADSDAAIANYQRALAIWGKLAAENPTVTDYESRLSKYCDSLRVVLRETRDRENEQASYRRELVIWETLSAESPTVTEFQNGLATCCHAIGGQQYDRGDREAALASYQRALVIREKLVADHADNVNCQIQVGGSYCDLGRLLLTSDAEGALVWYTRALDTLRRVVDHDPRHPTARFYLRNTYWGRASALDALGRHAEAADAWQHTAEFDDGDQLRLTCRLSRAAALARAGDHARAAAEAAELAAIDKLPGVALYNLGCVLSVAAAAAKDDMALADQYAQRAVELLGRAKGAGFFADRANVEHIGKDTDLDALRERDDFRKFVDELTKQPPPKQE